MIVLYLLYSAPEICHLQDYLFCLLFFCVWISFVYIFISLYKKWNWKPCFFYLYTEIVKCLAKVWLKFFTFCSLKFMEIVLGQTLVDAPYWVIPILAICEGGTHFELQSQTNYRKLILVQFLHPWLIFHSFSKKEIVFSW